MRTSLVVLANLLAFAVAWATAAAQTQPVVTDYDRRATAALRSTLADKPQPLETIGEQEVRNLTRFEKTSVAGRHAAVYALNIGANQNGVDTSGFIRINIGAGEPATTGWTRGRPVRSKMHGVDVDTFYRLVEASGSIPSRMNVGVRCSIGGLLLTIAQRRPPGEDVNLGLLKLADRMDALITYAKTYRLFMGEWTFSVVSRNGEPLTVAEPLTFSLADDQETQQVVRAEFKTPEGIPAPDFKHTKVRLSGVLAPLVTLAVGDTTLKGPGVLELAKPQVDFEIRMTLPAQRAPEVFSAVTQQLQGITAGATPEPPIRLRVAGLTEESTGGNSK